MRASGISAVLLSLCLVTFASAQDTFTVDITRTDGGGAACANDCVGFEIRGHLTDSANEGLAFFAFDLEVVSDPPGSTINLGSVMSMGGGPAVDNFSQPQGYSVDFTGTVVGDDLIQAGGGQNTIGNTGVDPFPPFPSGAVALNLGHGVDGVVLFDAPAVCPVLGFSIPGDVAPDTTYTLQIKPGSLYANVITSHDVGLDTYVVDPVTTAIGTGVTFCSCSAPTPEIVHEDSLPCTGTIDAAIESTDGLTLDLGLQQTEIHFNTEVFQSGGAAVDASNFSIVETGALTAPGISGVAYGADNSIVIVDWDRPLTLQEWTTITADVYNACGVAIVNGGDQGPGVDETDRVDLGFLPGDVNRSSDTTPFDLISFRQLVNSVQLPSAFGCSSDILDYADINRDGASTPFDLITFRQIVNGVSPPTTQPWGTKTMNNTRP